MENAYIAMVAGILILLASMASVEMGLSVALIRDRLRRVRRERARTVAQRWFEPQRQPDSAPAVAAPAGRRP